MTVSPHFRALRVAKAGALLAAFVSLGPAVCAQQVDTASFWDGVSFIAPFGQGNEQEGGDTPSYGQTFRAPAANLALTSFTFWLDSVGGSGATRFTGFIMEFGGFRATGPVLFGGAEVSLAISTPTFSPYVPSFTAVTFDVPSLALDPGLTYIAFISALPFFDNFDDTANVGYLFADAYDGGGFWFSNQRTWNAMLDNDWENFIGGGVRDLAFRASFGAVPEPAVFTMAGAIALIVLVLTRRRH